MGDEAVVHPNDRGSGGGERSAARALERAVLNISLNGRNGSAWQSGWKLIDPTGCAAPVDANLVDFLVAQPVSCRLWPEQTNGRYDRPVHPERRDIAARVWDERISVVRACADAITERDIEAAL
jgi:hypothetical protein